MPASHNQPVIDHLVAAIRSGELPAGTRLPTHRALAREHGMALQTATRVYEKLAQMGLVVGEAGRGTFVRDQMGYEGLEATRKLPVPRIADLSFNQPLSPGQTDLLRQALKSLASAGNLDALLFQQPPGGRSHERRIVATYLLDRGIDVPPGNLLITNGSQQGLDAALDATTEPGDPIAIDALTYPGMCLLAESRKHALVSVPVASNGPDLDALERACHARHVKAIYTIPTMHNPLSWVLTRQQRERVVDIARREDAYIIEDGTYSFLVPDAPPPIYALAPERTVYVASLSKNLATGLRFGFVVAPDPLIRHLRSGLRASTWGSPSIVTALASGWIADGTLARLEKERRIDAHQRQNIIATALAGFDMITHPMSYYVWLLLKPEQRMDAVATKLATQGIIVSTAEPFSTDGRPPHALRLAIGTPELEILPDVLAQVRTTLDAIG